MDLDANISIRRVGSVITLEYEDDGSREQVQFADEAEADRWLRDVYRYIVSLAQNAHVKKP